MVKQYVVRYDKMVIPKNGAIRNSLHVVQVLAKDDNHAKEIIKNKFEVATAELTIKIDIIEIDKLITLNQNMGNTNE